ncbi:MAG: class I SAM-dependent methyltransferase, partial [Asgard group archaeon]|nr:class I SAM-dependent methyltransferase [Asgard group archaeon]
MPKYNDLFAKIYDKDYTIFAKKLAPIIYTFYQKQAISEKQKNLLDLGCGTGQFANYFLKKGFQVVGIDVSPAMLTYARKNNQEFITKNQATFIEGDMTNFSLKEQFGLATATFDVMNHLPSKKALSNCLSTTFKHITKGGMFIFDINTRRKLLYEWDDMIIKDTEEYMQIQKKFVPEKTNKIHVKITGFIKNQNGLYQRFDEYLYNYYYSLVEVKKIIYDAGWKKVWYADKNDLSTPLTKPEREGRVYVIAQ